MAGKTRSRGYVREWMEAAQLKQSDLVKGLGWAKAKANAVWHGEQRLNEDMMEELAPLVNARPFELLIHPKTAFQIRRLEAVMADMRPDPEAPAPEMPRGIVPLHKAR